MSEMRIESSTGEQSQLSPQDLLALKARLAADHELVAEVAAIIATESVADWEPGKADSKTREMEIARRAGAHALVLNVAVHMPSTLWPPEMLPSTEFAEILANYDEAQRTD